MRLISTLGLTLLSSGFNCDCGGRWIAPQKRPGLDFLVYLNFTFMTKNLPGFKQVVA
jgi:hypothetical protein